MKMLLTISDLHESLESAVGDTSKRWEKPVLIIDKDGVAHQVWAVVHRVGSLELHVKAADS